MHVCVCARERERERERERGTNAEAYCGLKGGTQTQASGISHRPHPEAISCGQAVVTIMG